ncbi:hypothetical protein Ancab_004247 [Ancistrocladus abbreviatus]
MSAPPAWLSDLTNGRFTTSRAQNRSSTYFCRFCIDCRGRPFRDVDMSSHSRHTVIRVCKCSGHYAVKYDRISELLDCSGIHVYVINFNNIVFLKSRKDPHREGGGGNLEACRICRWKFPTASPDPVFCSLGCKYLNSAAKEIPPKEERGAMLTVGEDPTHPKPKERRRPRKGLKECRPELLCFELAVLLLP